ncbi:ketopantoate reductase family protein [Marininema halotolerans]|uniref:2-dehydropantoate 2-reductase n=1 Tax=Marininema halotolerans TaxID=1155944 RepID=A0A1I6SJF7_9BACL|nr:ketopantoate reductase family protein [Marininema halotolerans]SFS77077.1 2-dehydropantoate 2-reductase [Marininema halotolerans]
MRILVLGAGAVGGYFGGRLHEAGQDVTFLVRPGRKKQMDEQGLVIHSTHGDYQAKVKTISAGEQAEPFDVVLLSVKAYHLEQSLIDLAPYVGKNTMVIPLLNGVTHLAKLDEAFGEEKVIGGLCFIETTLNEKGEIEQYSEQHDIVFGERDGQRSERVERFKRAFDQAKATGSRSEKIKVSMWQKYLFIAVFSGITSLMGESIGPIREAPGGRETIRELVREVALIAYNQEPELNEGVAEITFSILDHLDASMKASMLRDIEKYGEVEADHLHGSLLKMAPEGVSLPRLTMVYAFLKVYEGKRKQDQGR